MLKFSELQNNQRNCRCRPAGQSITLYAGGNTTSTTTRKRPIGPTRWRERACRRAGSASNHPFTGCITSSEWDFTRFDTFITFSFSHITHRAQYEHPCLVPCFNYPPESYTRYVLPRPTHYQPHSVLVPANPYLLEEIPHWLNVYFKSEWLSNLLCSCFCLYND